MSFFCRHFYEHVEYLTVEAFSILLGKHRYEVEKVRCAKCHKIKIIQ